MSDKVLLAGEGSGKSVVVTREDTLTTCAMLQATNLLLNAVYYEEHGELMTEEEHDALFDKGSAAFGVDLANPMKQYKVSLAEYLREFTSASEFLLTYPTAQQASVIARVRGMATVYATGTWHDLPDRNKETE